MNLNSLVSALAAMNLSFVYLTPTNLHEEQTNLTDINFPDFHKNKAILLSEKSNIVSTRGFDFEYTGCEKHSSDELICSFRVQNNQQPRSLAIHPNRSKIIDEEGNIIFGSVAQLGAMGILGGTVVESEELPSQIPIKGKVLFREIPANGKINYIEFNFSKFKVWFRPGS